MGHKTFEIRKNDRNFQAGDHVILNEWNPLTSEYTGRKMARVITYVLKEEDGDFGLKPGYAILSIQ